MFRHFIACSLTILTSSVLLLAHGDATHIMGTITAVQGDHVTIKQQDGKSVMVMMGKTTKYLKAEKTATGAELKVGTRVVIDAKMDEKMKMFAAEEVRIGVAARPAADGKATAAAPADRHAGHE